MRDRTSLGILELTLGADVYEWRFVPTVARYLPTYGVFTDSGTGACH